jgi:hypothetical protein
MLAMIEHAKGMKFTLSICEFASFQQQGQKINGIATNKLGLLPY